MVWINTDLTYEVANLGSVEAPIYDYQSEGERTVVVQGLSEYNGEEYVVYFDPVTKNTEALTWEQFTTMAAPDPGSRYRALVLGDREYPEGYDEVRFDYYEPAR